MPCIDAGAQECYYYAHHYDTFIRQIITPTYFERFTNLSKDERQHALDQVEELLSYIRIDKEKEAVRKEESSKVANESIDLLPNNDNYSRDDSTDMKTDIYLKNQQSRAKQSTHQVQDKSSLQPQLNKDEDCSSVEMGRPAIHDPDETMLLLSHQKTPPSQCFHYDDVDGGDTTMFFSSSKDGLGAKKKRNATTSGKKGLDLQRLRLTATTSSDDDHTDTQRRRNKILFSPGDDALNSSFSPPFSESVVSSKAQKRVQSLSLLLQSQSPIVPQCDDTESSASDPMPQSPVARTTSRTIRFDVEYSSQDENEFYPKNTKPLANKCRDDVDNFRKNINLNNSRFGIRDNGSGNSFMHPRGCTDDTIQSVDCTIQGRQRQLRLATSKRTKGPAITGRPHHNAEPVEMQVQLKKGACFRMPPLQVVHQRNHLDPAKNTHSKRTGLSRTTKKCDLARNNNRVLSFPDPINHVFSGRTAERLNEIVSWLKSQEKTGQSNSLGRQPDGKENQSVSNNANEASFTSFVKPSHHGGKGIILSLNSSQIHAVTIKFLSSCPCRHDSQHFNRANKTRTPDSTRGGVLLVLRDKDASMVEWERAVREKSSFSLLNHANLSCAVRKQLTMSRIAGFDIVLTTYDALKSKEKTYAIDAEHDLPIIEAKTNENNSEGSRWLAAASFTGDPIERRHCRQLSSLHGIRWKKVIFVDVLGPQSYSLKNNTARAAAGRSLVATSRYILFERNEMYDFEEDLKESTKQLNSLSSFLHFSDLSASEIVGEFLLDYAEDLVLGKGPASRYEPSNDSVILDDSNSSTSSNIWQKNKISRPSKLHIPEENDSEVYSFSSDLNSS